MSESEPAKIEIPSTEDWLRRLAGELLKLEPLLPSMWLPQPDAPAWVQKAEAEIGNALFPDVGVKDFENVTPKRFGALIGTHCAHAVWMMEWLQVQIDDQFQGLAAKTQEVVGQSKIEVDESETEKAAHALDMLADKWYPKMRRLAKLALCSSVDRSYDEMTGFLLGFSAGFARKPRGLRFPSIGSTALPIYVILVMCWPWIQQLQSVRQLHEVLVKALGPYRTGDLKRIEKICQRIGLHFRKPGRPKKPS